MRLTSTNVDRNTGNRDEYAHQYSDGATVRHAIVHAGIYLR